MPWLIAEPMSPTKKGLALVARSYNAGKEGGRMARNQRGSKADKGQRGTKRKTRKAVPNRTSPSL